MPSLRVNSSAQDGVRHLLGRRLHGRGRQPPVQVRRVRLQVAKLQAAPPSAIAEHRINKSERTLKQLACLMANNTGVRGTPWAAGRSGAWRRAGRSCRPWWREGTWRRPARETLGRRAVGRRACGWPHPVFACRRRRRGYHRDAGAGGGAPGGKGRGGQDGTQGRRAAWRGIG